MVGNEHSEYYTLSKREVSMRRSSKVSQFESLKRSFGRIPALLEQDQFLKEAVTNGHQVNQSHEYGLKKEMVNLGESRQLKPFSVLEKSNKRNNRLQVSGSLEKIFGHDSRPQSDAEVYKALHDQSSLTNLHEDFTQDSSEADYLRDLSVQIHD